MAATGEVSTISQAPGATVAPAHLPTALTVYPNLRGKRVAIVVLSGYPSDSRPFRAAAALAAQGMDIDYLCLSENNEPRREKTDGIDVTRLRFTHRRGGKLGYIWEYSWCTTAMAAILAKRILRHRYDLVYINNMPEVLVASALIPKLMGAKVILDMHDPMPELMTTIFQLPEDSFALRLLKWLEKWSMARANLVLTVNIACERMFGARSCPPNKLAVVMNSPDGDVFPYRAPRASMSMNRTSQRPFVVMYHGSLLARNGVDLAVDAVAKLRDRIPSVVLRIYGDRCAFLDRVMTSVRDRGLEGSVQYLGSKTLQEIVTEIEDCDVGVIPNHRNAFTEINTPTRIFEYLATGKPVIAPRTSGITDYFGDDSLVFFEAGNADDLARQIEYVATHRDEALRITERGQEVYLAHTWEKEREVLARVVSDLLQSKSS